jgi:hypothetical protein
MRPPDFTHRCEISPPAATAMARALCVRAFSCGTGVAPDDDMPRELPVTLTMPCPRCEETRVEAASDSSPVIAWFTCPACGYDWSARLRNGRPEPAAVIPATALLLPQTG